MTNLEKQTALARLRSALGPTADFRPGQWEAIEAAAMERKRVLVVQRTGWGKSLVYLLATRLLRDQGLGPTLLISPLLSLMRNQSEMAERFGVRARSLNSANRDDWDTIESELERDQVDLLLISPERLANERFRTSTLQRLENSAGLIVVDEAHCISDWGHDFRPDYRRIAGLLDLLPRGVPVIATTATASDRVVTDIVEQLGHDLVVQRGPLARSSLVVAVYSLPGKAERFAWLVQTLWQLPGSGIVYCLTVADADRVSQWLELNGIEAPAYHAQLTDEKRQQREQLLLGNQVKALVSTVALGMGFDKPDLGFVVHFQRPGSPVAYYQQIGRAGRALPTAYALLLHGEEDDAIQDYFINTAFPGSTQVSAVLDCIEASDGVTRREILARVNIPSRRLDQCLSFLDVAGAIFRDGSQFVRSLNPWHYDTDRADRIIEVRRQEVRAMEELLRLDTCLMQFVGRQLDDEFAVPCGRCSNCAGLPFPQSVDAELVGTAARFLRRSYVVIEPRKMWPVGIPSWRAGRIEGGLLNAAGRALSMYGDPGWGALVKPGKYEDHWFSDALVDAALEMIAEWQPTPSPRWITSVPSQRDPELVRNFAIRLANKMGLPYRETIRKLKDVPPQKGKQNSSQQAANVDGAFGVAEDQVLPGALLLVDDLVDSKWTFTVCGALLRTAGSGVAHPLALASATVQE